jgi:5-methylcytosine-specific restriction endonuclease McrA
MQPTPEEQINFLSNVQRLLAETKITATYKYALLLALAEIAVEYGDDSGTPLAINTALIAEKFIHFYWRQAIPYVPAGQQAAVARVLSQNTGGQASVITQIESARGQGGGSLAGLQHQHEIWNGLVRNVEQVVRIMPLWKLQRIGNQVFDFLYAHNQEGVTDVQLRPGVAFCLRRFHSLINDLVRGAWLRYLRQHNHDLLGTTVDLAEFCFGSDRRCLDKVRPILMDLQADKCFYCRGELRGESAVDHFIPWSKYPSDLGHNYVLVHRSCNAAKADRMAAEEHLAAWASRNERFRTHLATTFDGGKIPHDLQTTVRIAHWAYGNTFDAKGRAWLRGDELIPLSRDWPVVLSRAPLQHP